MFETFKSKINRSLKIITTGATLLTYKSWFEAKEESNKLKNQMLDIKNEISNLSETVNKDVIDNSIKNKIIEEIQPLKESFSKIEILEQKVDSIIEQTQMFKSKPDSAIMTEIQSSKEEIGKILSKTITKLEELEKFLEENEWTKKLSDDNFLFNLIKEYKDYLSTLSVEELCILMNLLVCVFILTCLITIIFAFYGNYFINKLSLETKYPKISGFIKWRIKFQHYYIIVNSIYIVVALGLISYVNFVTLFVIS